MTKAFIQGAGEIDESADLWPLFVADADYVYGLFPGQLWSELLAAIPSLRPRIVETLKRGLRSDDPTHRRAAIEALRFVSSPDYAADLEHVAREHRDWLVEARDYGGGSILALFLGAVVVSRAQAAFDALGDAWVATAAVDHGVEALVLFAPERAMRRVLEDAAAGFRSPIVPKLIGALVRSAVRAELLGRVRSLPLEQRTAFVATARTAMRADEFSGAFDAWQSVADEVAVPRSSGQ